MSKLEAQARKIIESLESKPGLMFEILRIATDEYMLLGPWVPIENPKNPGDFYYERRLADGDSMATAARDPSDPQKWMWQVKGGQSGDTLTGPTGAQTLADGELTNIGWILA